VEFILVT